MLIGSSEREGSSKAGSARSQIAPEIIEKQVPEKYRDQIRKIIQKKKRQVEVRFTVNVKSFADDGVNKIKALFDLEDDNIKVTYISAGKFKLRLIAEDFKEGKQKLQKVFDKMDEKAKSFNAEIEYKEEKN